MLFILATFHYYIRWHIYLNRYISNLCKMAKILCVHIERYNHKNILNQILLLYLFSDRKYCYKVSEKNYKDFWKHISSTKLLTKSYRLTYSMFCLYLTHLSLLMIERDVTYIRPPYVIQGKITSNWPSYFLKKSC